MASVPVPAIIPLIPAPVPVPDPPPPPPPFDPFQPIPPLVCPFPRVTPLPDPPPPPPPPPDIPPHLRGINPELLAALPNEILLTVLQACQSFEQLLWVRRACPQVNNIFRLNMGPLLTHIGARIIRRSGSPRVTAACMQYAIEILIFQRYQYQSWIPPQGRNTVFRIIYERLENVRQSLLFMRIADIPQFKANHLFFEGFRRFYRKRLDDYTYTLNQNNPQRYARLKDESQLDFLGTHNTELESIQFPVDDLLSVEDFYHAWVLTYRFKYEPITSFARRLQPIDPLVVGKIHFIAFLMDQFYMSQVPFNRQSSAREIPRNILARVERRLRRTRILEAWKKRCFMGVWYPLKTTDDGIFSMNFALGIWRKVTAPGGGLLGWSYFVSDLMGGFTPVDGAGGHLLYWKFLTELAARSFKTAPLASQVDGSWETAFIDLKADFDLQFNRRNIVQLMNRFGLEEPGYVRNNDV